MAAAVGEPKLHCSGVCHRPPGLVEDGRYSSSRWVALSQRRIRWAAWVQARMAIRFECGDGRIAKSLWPHAPSAPSRASLSIYGRGE